MSNWALSNLNHEIFYTSYGPLAFDIAEVSAIQLTSTFKPDVIYIKANIKKYVYYLFVG